MNLPTLTIEAGALVRLAPEHAASLQRQADAERVWQTLFENFPRPYTLVDADADADARCGGGWRAGGHVWGSAVEGGVIGCVGVRWKVGWVRCNAEVGYWIGRQYWGRGIATPALRAAADWAFANMDDVTRHCASIFDWNEASQSVKKSGLLTRGPSPVRRDQGPARGRPCLVSALPGRSPLNIARPRRRMSALGLLC